MKFIPKIIHLLFTLLFIAFAYVQLNDPDGLLWFLIYLLPAGIALLFLIGKNPYIWSLRLGILMIIGLLYYIPSIVDWVDKGMPSIVESMQAESPHIEWVRESLGLLIIIISSISYWKYGRSLK